MRDYYHKSLDKLLIEVEYLVVVLHKTWKNIEVHSRVQ